MEQLAHDLSVLALFASACALVAYAWPLVGVRIVARSAAADGATLGAVTTEPAGSLRSTPSPRKAHMRMPLSPLAPLAGAGGAGVVAYLIAESALAPSVHPR